MTISVCRLNNSYKNFHLYLDEKSQDMRDYNIVSFYWLVFI